MAIPAWSHPGTHSTLWPCILLLVETKVGLVLRLPRSLASGARAHHRTRASSTATVRAWPTCSVPVTLGGGKQREKVCSTAWTRLSWGPQHTLLLHLCFRSGALRPGLLSRLP